MTTEVGQYVPAARPPMTGGEAQEFVKWAKAAQDELVQRVYEAYNRQAHLALGYASWEDMCVGEGLGFYKLPADKRKPAVIQLKSLGMSNRAIGQALGASKDTVARDARSNGGSNEPFVTTETVLEGTVVDDGTSGQDRESYSDEQDRESYVPADSYTGVTAEVREGLKTARHHLRRARTALQHDETKDLSRQVFSLIGEVNNMLAAR